ncbi:MAG: hypothetical protein ACHQ3P_03440 [Candidatus Limnocylindrales bacterium]
MVGSTTVEATDEDESTSGLTESDDKSTTEAGSTAMAGPMD